MNQIDHARFIEMLASQFPEIAGRIDDTSKGLLHLEMGHFVDATNDAIRNEDIEQVRDHFRFIDEVFARGTPDVANAVGVSYLEHLIIQSRAAQHRGAHTLLSPRLRKELAALDG
jgi:hypothetical protein